MRVIATLRELGIRLARTLERERTQNALRDSESRFRSLANAAADAIISIDAGGRIVFWNPAAERTFGYGEADVLGRSLETIIPERYREGHARGLRHVVETGQSTLMGRPIELHGLRRDGTEFPLELTLSSWSADRETYFTAILRDITERKRSQQDLERLVQQRTVEIEREKEFSKRVLSSLPSQIAVLDAGGRIITVNRAWRRFSEENGGPTDWDGNGWNYLEVCRRSAEKGAPGAAQAAEAIRAVLSGTLPEFSLEYSSQARGVAEWFLLSVSPLPEDIGGAVVAHVNVSERVRAEHERRESEERFRAMADTTPIMIWVAGPDGRCSFVNKAWMSYTGRTLEQALGDGWSDTLHPDDHDRCLRTYEAATKAQRPFRMEYRLRGADGEHRWILDTGEPRLAEGGEFAGFIGSCLDITERRQDEDALRESEARFRLVADSAPVMLWMSSLDGSSSFYNRRCRDFTGSTESDGAKRWLESVHEQDFERTMTTYREAVDAREPFQMEYRLRRHDGVYRWVLDSGVPRFDAAGTVEGYIGSSLDITDRRTAEQDLRESEERFRQIAENVSAVYWMQDVRTEGLLYVSPAFERVWGRTVESLRGDSHAVRAAIHPDDLQASDATFSLALARQEPSEAEYRILRPDGTIRWIHDRRFPVRGASGETERVVGIAEDVTERKLREREREAIVAVTAALRTAATAAEMLPVVLDKVTEILKSDCSGVVLRRESEGDLVMEIGRGGWADLTGRIRSDGESLSAGVMASGQPFLENSVAKNPRLAADPVMAGLAAAACVPLIAGSRTLGALWVGRSSAIAEDELQVLTVIAESTANALRRATLHEQTERRLRQITALRAGEMAISSSLDLHLTLNVLLEQITSLLEVDASAVLLLNPSTSSLDYAAQRGFLTSAYALTQLHVGESVARQAVLERQRLQVADLRAESDLAKSWLVSDEGFTFYVAVPLVAKGTVKGVLELFHRSPLATSAEWLDLLDSLALQASVAIDNATMFDEANRSHVDLALAYDRTLEGWSRALELRDRETEGHTARVTEITVGLAHATGMREEEIVQVRRGALLHDIGKMGIPDSILLKPGPLDEEEWRIMRLHPVYARDLLSPISFLDGALDIPYCHHERWDGTGYPRGLEGEEIPLAARIFAVVDVWDALRSDRCYRPAWPDERVRDHLRRGVGTHFEPRIVELFLRVTAAEPVEVALAPKGPDVRDGSTRAPTRAGRAAARENGPGASNGNYRAFAPGANLNSSARPDRH